MYTSSANVAERQSAPPSLAISTVIFALRPSEKSGRPTLWIPLVRRIREPFKDLWAYFQAMLRLIRAYYRREYRNVPLQNLVMIVGAIIYILNPFDLIPDWIAGLGFADDAVVLAFTVRRTRQTLDDFMTWEIASRDRPVP